ncbi:DNA-binding transcriptional LysR family regulator [Pacificibacter maritimus]|uniref:DNA-binding transcriptional LysR family regulator n=1 Tax=Pacificibacter maritimus TaxID=762213 RepID=A0A3N4ULK6_9RHOB|nr:LysR family transcriptional regulator [Pacificibacter maritimus]RPE71526.1 DNA-binding transcriptional LysR family regulator [Pacificibacter maritimus]
MTQQHSNLSNLDMRALEILLLVYKEKSFTRAADSLGVSQSVVSYNIDKVRKVVGDPLFVREAGVTLPTEKCVSLVTLSEEMLLRMEDLQSANTFDPTTTTDPLVIACNYYERLLLIPSIVATFRSLAPSMPIEIIDASGLGHEKLLNREADILIGPFNRTDTAFYARTLFTDNYVCMMDAANPAVQSELTLETYLKLDHIVVTYGGMWKSFYLTELERLGHQIRPMLRVPSPAGIEEIVSGSPLVATLPAGMGRKICGSLRLVPCPIQQSLPIRIVWTAQHHHSAKIKWVRDIIAETMTA